MISAPSLVRSADSELYESWTYGETPSVSCQKVSLLSQMNPCCPLNYKNNSALVVLNITPGRAYAKTKYWSKGTVECIKYLTLWQCIHILAASDIFFHLLVLGMWRNGAEVKKYQGTSYFRTLKSEIRHLLALKWDHPLWSQPHSMPKSIVRGSVLMELRNLDKLNWRFFTLSVSSSGAFYLLGHIEHVADGTV